MNQTQDCGRSLQRSGGKLRWRLARFTLVETNIAPRPQSTKASKSMALVRVKGCGAASSMSHDESWAARPFGDTLCAMEGDAAQRLSGLPAVGTVIAERYRASTKGGHYRRCPTGSLAAGRGK